MKQLVKTRELLVFSWGVVDCPTDMLPPRHRRKNGELDRRFRAVRDWWKRFNVLERKGSL